MVVGASDRTLLHEEPNHGVVREPHLRGRERVWRGSGRGNLLWQASKGFDDRRSCFARGGSESSRRIFADFESGEGEGASRSGFRFDGQEWFCIASGSRWGKNETDPACRFGLLSTTASDRSR